MRLLLLLLFPLYLKAEYRIGFGTGSYMGRHQLQGEKILEKYNLVGIVGYTQDKDLNEIYQITAIGTQALKEKEFGNLKWIPLHYGVFATYTNHKKFYINSPSKYNDQDYYTETALRMGLRFSTELTFNLKSHKPLHFSVDGSLLDRGLTSFYNNTSEIRLLEEFWSLGFSFRFEL